MAHKKDLYFPELKMIVFIFVSLVIIIIIIMMIVMMIIIIIIIIIMSIFVERLSM